MPYLKLSLLSLLGWNLFLLSDFSEPVTERFSFHYCKQFHNNQILLVTSNRELDPEKHVSPKITVLLIFCFSF